MKELKGVKLLKVDKANKNGNLIPHDEIEKYLEAEASKKDCLCPLEAPMNVEPASLDKVAYKLSSLRLEGDYLVGDIKALDTPPYQKQ